ncbi:MAG: hypothetical protein AAF744_09440 [Pseudomonadota bacterium]
MTRFASALVAAFLLTTPAAAQDTNCTDDDYLENAMIHIESHYRSFPEELFTAQLFLKEGFDNADLTPDGKWGPKTRAAMCSALQGYTSVGGSDGDWGIRRASHTPQFTNWLLRAARSNLSGGEVEFPD